MYSEFLLEAARSPQNNMRVENPTCCVSVVNEGCSDSLELSLRVENGYVVEVGFIGTLCALSTAASSLFTEFLKGKNIHELKLITPGVVYSLLNVTITESRTRCALLCYSALQKSLKICSQ